MSEPFLFEHLVAPHGVEAFLAEHWERAPLHVPRDDPGYYDRLFSMAAFESVVHYSRTVPPDLRVVAEQTELLPSRYLAPGGGVDLNQVYKAYAEGHTLVINALHRFSPPLAAFCRYLQGLMSFNVVANAYLTPAHSRGLHPHYDTHDVFVLQVAGAKTWQLYGAAEESPLLGAFQPVIPEQKLPPPRRTVPLAAGDLLYIPRGEVHQARSDQESSLHLTIGIYPTQWLDLLTTALTHQAVGDVRLRKALPVGYLDDPEAREHLAEQFQALAEAFRAGADLGVALEYLRDGFIRHTIPVPDDHFSQVDAAASLGLDSLVTRRPGHRCRVIDGGSQVSIQFPGNTVAATPAYARALRYIADAPGPFRVGALPDDLDAGRKVLLAQRLIRGGLLRRVDADAGGDA